jgi:hypothetical protein
MLYTWRASKLYLLIVVVICPGHLERVPVDEARYARERLKVIGDCCREGFQKKRSKTGPTPVALQRRWGRTKESRGYLLKLFRPLCSFPHHDTWPPRAILAKQGFPSRASELSRLRHREPQNDNSLQLCAVGTPSPNQSER